MDFKLEYNTRIKKIDDYIESYLNSITDTQENLLDAIKYSVLNGGKRIRSILCTEIASINGVDEDTAYKFAAAIEFIHAYSLVHDDLPCMDDDDFRRGMPSCHKKYGEAMAVLTGDALLTLAFELMSSSAISENSKNCVKAMNFVAKKAGMCGMINGQVIDINNSGNKDADVCLLLELVNRKCSDLIVASVVAPVIICGADDDEIEKYSEFAYNLGAAFQIRDDFEDISQDDGDDGSPNFINILGKENTLNYIKDFVEIAYKTAYTFNNNDFLIELLDYLFDKYR